MALPVTVCSWVPQHTLQRAEAQAVAVMDGTIARLAQEHGRGTDALRQAMKRARLVTKQSTLHGETVCPECGSLMETVLASDGIVSENAALRDVVADYSKAIDRTRRARRAARD